MASNTLSSTGRTIGWGLYCACSWTWCIGMYLPIIMLAWYGWPGFLVFAVPNVLGCAAFGYIVRHRRRSEAMVATHRPAMRTFSLVTIAFHVFFVGMISMRLGAGRETIDFMPAAALAVIVFAGGLAIGAVPRRWLPWLAAAVYGVSLAAFAMIGVEPLGGLTMHGVQPSLDVLWLSPAIVFGFLLCPYLDLTFHRALQASPSRHSFAVFGVTFAVMLVLTAAYHALGSESIEAMFGAGSIAGRFLTAHLFAQAVFTIGVHSRELRRDGEAENALGRGAVAVLPLLGLTPVAAGAMLQWTFAMNEQMYIRWLVFYGLVFPAYVLVFIGPWRAKRLTLSNLAQLAVAIIAFIPLYELAFVHHWTIAVVPPVVLLAVAVFITPGTARSEAPKR